MQVYNQKLKQRAYRKYLSPPPGPPWQAGIEVGGPNCTLTLEDLREAPPVCNSWTSLRSDESGNFFARYGSQTGFPLSTLAHQSLSSQHSVSPNGQFSIRSNVSSDSNIPRFIFGELTVALNPNKAAKDGLLSIAMQASSSTLRKDTNVCFSMADDACDLVIYVSHYANCWLLPLKFYVSGSSQS
jgi:hypothetical protein